MKTLQDRIAELMSTTGLTVGELANIAGVTSSAATQWKDGPTKTLKAAPAAKLAEKTGFSALWLSSGEGPKMRIDDVANTDISKRNAMSLAWRFARARSGITYGSFPNAELDANSSRLETGNGETKPHLVRDAVLIYGGPADDADSTDLPQFLRKGDAENVKPAQVGTRRIPVISSIQAGVWSEIVDGFQPGDAEDWLVTDIDLSESAFALDICGNSMEPEFKAGDRVIIDPSITPQPGDFVAAKNGEEEATFKKYRPRGIDSAGNMVFELVPLNDDYPTLRSDNQPIKIVGTMVEHRKYRKR